MDLVGFTAENTEAAPQADADPFSAAMGFVAPTVAELPGDGGDPFAAAGGSLPFASDPVPAGVVGGVVGHGDVFSNMPAAAEAPTAMGPPGQLSALREWEIQHDNELEEVARNEAKEKENRRQAAVDLIKIYHQELSDATKKRQSSNRADEETMKQMMEATVRENPWEMVSDLIDLSARPVDGEARDSSRMRGLLIQLKSDPVRRAVLA